MAQLVEAMSAYPTAYGCIAKTEKGPEVIFSIITSSKEAAEERCKKYSMEHPQRAVRVTKLHPSIFEDEMMRDYFDQ